MNKRRNETVLQYSSVFKYMVITFLMIFDWLLNWKAVRHSDAVLTYARTYWIKDAICAGYIDCTIKICRKPFASRLTKFTAQPAGSVLPWSAARCSTCWVPVKPGSHFSGSQVRWISSRISSARSRTPLQTCFNMSAKVWWTLSVRLTFVTYVFGIDTTGIPNAMSATALTCCVKIRGFIAQDYERLRRNKRHRESRTEKQCSQHLRIQTPYSLEKNSRPTSRGGRLELSLPTKLSTPLYIKTSQNDTSPNQQMLVDMKNSLAPPPGELIISMAPHITAPNQSIATSVCWTGRISDSLQIQHPLDRQISLISRPYSKERCSRPVALTLQHSGTAWQTYVMINGLM